MGISSFLDKIGDALVPKEIAPFLGPASMIFAGPLGIPAALALGQLGSVKMHSGKLDPLTALGTIMAGRAAGPQDGPTVSDRLGKGIGTLFDDTKGNADLFAGFRKGAFSQPVSTQPKFLRNTPRTSTKNPLATSSTSEMPSEFGQKRFLGGKENPLFEKSSVKLATEPPMYKNIPKIKPEDPSFLRRATGKGMEVFDSISDAVFPGFTKDGEFNLGNSLRTIGSITTISAMKPAAEALKQQKMKSKREEGRVWREWFKGYENLSGGVPYPQDNPTMADPFIIEKYNEFMLANGGRVGYNEGGGIMDVAPGIPKGMELDYRETGGFIPMGTKEKKDDVPAVLAKNEFVLTSDAMKGLDKMMGGSGDPRSAAKYMYNMMDQLEAMA